jgi:hypothetical protein
MRALRLWMAAFATGAVTPKSRALTPTVTDDSGTGDDLISLTPEGAATLIETIAPSRPTYADLFPSFRVAGCTNDPEPKSEDCHRHQLVDAF